jgi:VanZ family protein
VFIWAGVIFFASAQQTLPGPNTISLDYLLKKTAHIFVYAVLYFLTFRAVKKTFPDRHRLHFGLPLIFCILFAFSDEFHQSFVPGRQPSLTDVGYDAIGASITLLLVKWKNSPLNR